MAGGFQPIDEAQCEHYAAFASHLARREFDYIYWFLFIFVILMLFLSSWQYSGDFEAVQQYDPGSHEYRSKMKKCMAICALYSAISVVAIVMEVYALMALQFCDGEDLMSLYWSTWTMLQVGALIAIFGILLSVFNGLRGNKNPPWALALGTPVLVVAGIGHAVHGAMRKRVNRVRESRSMSRSRGQGRGRRGMSVSSSMNGFGLRSGGGRERSMSDLPISREETIRVEDSEREDLGGNMIGGREPEYRAKLVGYTTEGAPIIQFVDEPPSFGPERGSVLGRSEGGQVIVAFRRGMTSVQQVDGSGGGSGRGSVYYGEVGVSSFREKPERRSTSLQVPPSPLPGAGSGGLLMPPPAVVVAGTNLAAASVRSPSPNPNTRSTTPRPAVVRIAEPGCEGALPPV